MEIRDRDCSVHVFLCPDDGGVGIGIGFGLGGVEFRGRRVANTGLSESAGVNGHGEGVVRGGNRLGGAEATEMVGVWLMHGKTAVCGFGLVSEDLSGAGYMEINEGKSKKWEDLLKC